MRGAPQHQLAPRPKGIKYAGETALSSGVLLGPSFGWTEAGPTARPCMSNAARTCGDKRGTATQAAAFAAPLDRCLLQEVSIVLHAHACMAVVWPPSPSHVHSYRQSGWPCWLQQIPE